MVSVVEAESYSSEEYQKPTKKIKIKINWRNNNKQTNKRIKTTTYRDTCIGGGGQREVGRQVGRQVGKYNKARSGELAPQHDMPTAVTDPDKDRD